MPITQSSLIYAIFAQLHRAFLAQESTEELQSALRAYVEHWPGGKMGPSRIANVVRILIDRVREEHPANDRRELAIYDVLTTEILDECLALGRA